MDKSGTVNKAIAVLETLRELGPSPAALVGERLSIARPTAHRLLGSLAEHGLVSRDAAGRWQLGSGLLRLAAGLLAQEPIVAASRPYLEHAASDFGETFFVVTERSGKLVVLDRVEGSGLLRAAPEIGSELPLLETASGRLYLALAAESVAEGPRPQSGDEQRIAMAKKRKWDVNDGEWQTELTVVAAAVLVEGQLRGTIACATAASTLSPSRLKEAIRTTRLAAKETARALTP